MSSSAKKSCAAWKCYTTATVTLLICCTCIAEKSRYCCVRVSAPLPACQWHKCICLHLTQRRLHRQNRSHEPRPSRAQSTCNFQGCALFLFAKWAVLSAVVDLPDEVITSLCYFQWHVFLCLTFGVTRFRVPHVTSISLYRFLQVIELLERQLVQEVGVRSTVDSEWRRQVPAVHVPATPDGQGAGGGRQRHVRVRGELPAPGRPHLPSGYCHC